MQLLGAYWPKEVLLLLTKILKIIFSNSNKGQINKNKND